jgi:hypothetical protein
MKKKLSTAVALIISGSVTVLVVAGVSLGVAFYRNRKRRLREYQLLPEISKKISFKDIANDVNIKQISLDELEIGDRVSIGAGGEVLRGKLKDKDVAIKRMVIDGAEIFFSSNFFLNFSC